MPEEKKTEESKQETKKGCCESSDCKCDSKDVQENKVLAAISYIWILFLIPLLGKKNSPYAQFHAKQGLALFVLSIAIYAATMIPIIGWFLISWLGSIVIFVFFVIGLVNALSGKCTELPWVGGWFKDIKF